jgi:hypothetical protein
MRAILVDPYAEKVSTVDHDGDYRSIYKLIDCRTFTTLRLNAQDDTLYLDDEGLLTMTERSKFILFKGYPQPLVGKGLILGTDQHGESVEPTVSEGAARKLFNFCDYNTAALLARRFGG